MRYEDARPQIRDGDLIAFRGTGLISRLIRRVTMGGFTHVGIAWRWPDADRLFLLEAKELSGIQLRALSNVGDFSWITTGASWTDEAYHAAVEELGKPYSYLDAVRAGIGRPMKGKAGICSAYARQRLRDCGLLIPDAVQHPQALVEWVQAENPQSVTRMVRSA